MRAPALIAGGGIGGLAAAIGLSQAGRDVIVFEKAPVISEIGAGLQLGPNAFAAFDRLGVGAEVRAIAVHIEELRLMDAVSAEKIAIIDLGPAFRERFNNPYAVVHRGELHRALLNACLREKSIDLRTDSEVVDYQQDGASVHIRLASGSTVDGSLLIGADGLWSNVRRKVVGDGAPTVSGHTTYRSVIPIEEMPATLRWSAATLWAGPKCHLVHYPLSDWKSFNLVVTCHNNAPEPVAGKPVSHDEVQRNFQSIHDLPRQIITHGTNWKLWVLCDREPVSDWVDGRVALLGDAAHPTLQYMAQGACMAVEDAVCLSETVREFPDAPEKALREYCARRILRTSRVQLQSRAIGEHIYHPAGAHALLRNDIMRAKTSADYYEALAWLYGGTGAA
jgi:3-hydroxybenzoate 6-monooxygenase